MMQSILKQHQPYHPVVPFDPATDKLLLLDFTQKNNTLSNEIVNDTQKFTNYINDQLFTADAKYGIGGYAEHRTVYSRSSLFSAHPDSTFDGQALTEGKRQEASRTLHLGIDIWGKPHTKVMAALDGMVHSFAFNNAYGDYGATIILTHQLDGKVFHTLYGHLSLNSLKNLNEGDSIRSGDVIAEFGIPFENGQWPPHLHFQVIENLEGMKGDYPGVCALSEREKYLANCPDPDLILGMMKFVFANY